VQIDYNVIRGWLITRGPYSRLRSQTKLSRDRGAGVTTFGEVDFGWESEFAWTWFRDGRCRVDGIAEGARLLPKSAAAPKAFCLIEDESLRERLWS